MYQQQTFANSLIQASVDANNKQRLRFIECKEKTAQERVDKMKFLTDVYFEDVNKQLMKAAIEGTNMYALVPFYVDHFQVSKELEELGVFIGYPNEIANRWFNEMQDPESKFLSNPSLNWSGLSFEIQQRFEGIKLKYPGEKAKDGREIFYIKFSWTRDMRFWSKYEGVLKVHKQDVREKEQFVFKIPQKEEIIPVGYTTSPSNVSERFDNAERAAKEFDNALVAIGLKAVNFPNYSDVYNLEQYLSGLTKEEREEWDKNHKDGLKSEVKEVRRRARARRARRRGMSGFDGQSSL